MLLEGLAERDPVAMGRLYERYAKLVYAKLNQIVNDRAAAEDLVQEVFLTIWKRAGELDPQRGTLKAWLRATAHNRAVDYLRARNRVAAPASLDLTKMEIPDLLTDFEREIAGCESIKRVLLKLNGRHQEVILLAFYQGLSHSEMAESMRKPLGTVKAWMRQALLIIRKELQEAQSLEEICRAASHLRSGRSRKLGRRKRFVNPSKPSGGGRRAEVSDPVKTAFAVPAASSPAR